MTTTATPASNSRAPESSLAAVENAFSWFNNLGARRIPLNRSDIDRHFTPDLKLMIDMKVMAGGLDAMAQRIELTRIEEQGPNLVERCCDILYRTNAQRSHTPNVS
jgi:hypothetical protein